MPHSLFISDLHLCEEQTHTTQLFLRFMRDTAPQAEALYILGDLFEYWAGDDDLGTPFHRTITASLHALATRGTRIFIMHGNRDFLMADQLAHACQATLLPDPTLLDLYGQATLLSHGDILCTDDAQYQAFRRQVRNPEWRAAFLTQPLAQRKAQIEQLRQMSENQKQAKSMDIMDVNPDAVAQLLRDHRYPRLIHGHTHRLALHQHSVDGNACERWVLGDWHKSGNALRCDAQGCKRLGIQ
jgi:UDP-2,3-diacylglucosamine hydrolase